MTETLDIKLGVNIDHIATLRNARGEKFPDPIKAAEIALNSGADSITAHLREDRRHIKDRDIRSCLLYTSPSPRDRTRSRMPSSA